MENSPRLNWTTQFLTMVYDGVFSPNVFIRMDEFPSAPCLVGKKKLDDNSRLDVVEIARVT